MRHVTFIVTLLMFLTACGVETVNVAAPEEGAEEEKAAKAKSEKDSEESDETVTTTTTTTTTTTIGGEVGAARRIVAEYELVNQNPAITDFIGKNYCIGSHLRDCWVKSGLMTEYSDGSFFVALEFWETYEDIPYTVKDEKITEKKAVLLTDKAKILGDDAVGYRMLWAVIDPETKTVEIDYDWHGDGPNKQGDDSLDFFEFVEISEVD
jgi:hypothetical protein